MSEWYEVKDKVNVEIDDGKFIVNFNVNYQGNCYVTIPVSIVKALLDELPQQKG